MNKKSEVDWEFYASIISFSALSPGAGFRAHSTINFQTRLLLSKTDRHGGTYSELGFKNSTQQNKISFQFKITTKSSLALQEGSRVPVISELTESFSHSAACSGGLGITVCQSDWSPVCSLSRHSYNFTKLYPSTAHCVTTSSQ